MIAYLDPSMLARAYLADEPGHDEATAWLDAPDVARVTGSGTRAEASSALVQAAHAGRGNARDLLAVLDADLGDDGRVVVLVAPQAEVERDALELVRRYAIRAMDAWHVAVASLLVPSLRAPDEEMRFATRDARQAEVASALGFDTGPLGLEP